MVKYERPPRATANARTMRREQTDAERDQWLTNEGYVVVRYSNVDILKNPDGVLSDLSSQLEERRRVLDRSPSPGLGSQGSPRPPSPPEGRGKEV